MERVHEPSSVGSDWSLKQQKFPSRGCGGWKSNIKVSAGLVPSGVLPPPADGTFSPSSQLPSAPFGDLLSSSGQNTSHAGFAHTCDFFLP